MKIKNCNTQPKITQGDISPENRAVIPVCRLLPVLMIGFILCTILAVPVGAEGSQDISINNSVMVANHSMFSQIRMSSLAIPFIQNNGQQPDSVKFYADTFYGTAYITGTDLTHEVAGTRDNETCGVALKEQFVNSDGTAIPLDPEGEDPSGTRISYFIGNDSSKWQTGLSTYNLVSLGELYPGITVDAKAHGNNVEKLFTVAPGADPKAIRINVLGADSIRVADDGSLAIATGDGDVSMAAPKAYRTGQS